MTDTPDNIVHSLGDLSKKKRSLSIWDAILALGTVVVLVAFLLPAVRQPRGASRRSQCKNNLKQIGLALHNYHEAHGQFPPAYTVDENGKPLHSWRTLILPYIDQAPLYNTINLSKPWNDPANAKACVTAIPVYQCPSPKFSAAQTSYLAIVTSNSAMRPVEGRKMSEITDGLSNTMFVIEVPANRAVHWMSPQDADESLVLNFGPETKLDHSGGVHALLGDGSVRFLSVNLPAETRRALMSATGNETVGEF